MRLPDGSSATTCALARNAFTKASLSRDFYAEVQPAWLPCNKPPPTGWEGGAFELPVFTLSARDYQILSGMRPHDGGEAAAAPVSYTHLRAHETLMNL
eukprot:3378345-Prymnesium_polylepis.1